MNWYQPDNWVIVKITGDDPHYRVLAGWSGGYTTGDSWRMNSGITDVEEDDYWFRFRGVTGSWYRCPKEGYGLSMSIAYVWTSLQKKHGDKVELMPESTDWHSVDWILK